ncbi:BON domain-containing protein [Perlucidibaca aquatica]|uniref:BON domain-containing protein n=1 Tax=Perlucidibaca aquatica TaxID=1852776 RepID=UPI00083B382E|nr:BON domain-containing protein [Perlucidibaca aquatica]
MKITTLFASIMLATSGLVITGCSHHGHERSAGAVMSDSAITTKVKTALLAEKDINSMDIKVNTFKGNVQLSGFVDSQWQIDKAMQVTRAVHGVTSVKNDLTHKAI